MLYEVSTVAIGALDGGLPSGGPFIVVIPGDVAFDDAARIINAAHARGVPVVGSYNFV